MAEYYPLLAKAVASLPNSTLEARHAIYERARKALLGQLRAVQPPVPDADVERENQALDQAIARLEAEFAAPRSLDVSSAPAPAAKPAQPETPAEPQAQAFTPAPPATPQPPPSTIRPPIAAGSRPHVMAPPAPSMSPNPGHPASDAAASGPISLEPAAPSPVAASPAEPSTDAPSDSVNPGPLKTGPDDETALDTQPKPVAPSKPLPPGFGVPPSAAIKMRPEQQRPVAPQVKGPKQGPKGLWIVLLVIGFIVAGVGYAAWKLRDRPEDLTNPKSAQTQQQSDGSGKIVERIGDTSKGKDAAATGASPAGTPQVEPSTTNVPVTYRAALLVQAPEEQNKVKTYFGTVIWRLDNVSNGPGEALGTAIHANIDIPEDKFQASMTLRKNIDASLSASHTMTIVFTIQPSTPTGAIKQIGVPQMRKEDSATGESLIGLPVPIMENSFLIGLAKGSPEATNLELLKTRQWIDVPMLLADGRIAKLTFEKGVTGLRATEDAIASWQTQ